MALHPDITRKPDNEFVLDLANTAIALASRQQTRNAGSMTIPDGGVTEDGAPAGTGLVAGEQAASVGGVGKRLADGTLIPLADGNDMQELSDKADDIRTEADNTAAGLDAANTQISQTQDQVTGLTTSVSNAQQDATSALTQISTTQQDLSGFKQSVAQDYDTKSDALSRESAIQQDIDGLETTVSSTYATKDSVSDLSTSVSQTATDLTTRIQSAQDGVDGLQTVVRVDADGVHVGKQADGTTSGYSVLVNANGSVDIIGSDNGLDARFDSNGLGLVDSTTNQLRYINRSVFNTDPIFVTSSGSWHGNGHHTANRTWLVDTYDESLGDLRIQFDTNFSTSVRVDLGAYIASAVGNYGSANGTVSSIRGWCFQIWQKNADGTNTLFQDTNVDRAVKCTNAVWQQGTQMITGGTFSSSYMVTGLQPYSTYYLETRRGGSFYSPNGDTSGSYWCDWDAFDVWACVTPLS